MKQERWDDWELDKDPSLVNVIKALIVRIKSLEGKVGSLSRHKTENLRDVDKRLTDLEIVVGLVQGPEKLEMSKMPSQEVLTLIHKEVGKEK